MISPQEIEEIKSLLFHPLEFIDEHGNAEIPGPREFIELDGDAALHRAAAVRCFRAAELLIKAGVDVNAVGDMGYRPLHTAAAAGDWEIYDLLVAAGADVNAEDYSGARAGDFSARP